MNYMSVEEFVHVQEELLKIEQDCELNEQKALYESQNLKALEKRGICLQNLHVEHQSTGLYGRFIVKFLIQKKDADTITTHKLSPGDIVGLCPNKTVSNVEYLATGVVSSSGKFYICVAFTEEVDLNCTSLYRLIILTNDVTYRRLKRSLRDLAHLDSSSPCSRLLNSVFPCVIATEDKWMHLANEIKFFNHNLDDSQKKAVKFVLHTAHPISVIHGPPGTGKSTTVVEAIQQAVNLFAMKVLVCAPSNIAVDNLAEKLYDKGLKVVRLGHPARIVNEVQKLSLDAILMSRDSSDIIKSVREDISLTINGFKKCCNKSEWYELKKNLKNLRKELSSRETKAIVEVLEGADVILSTTINASKEGPLKHLKNCHFDLLIIDEAAQAIELSCWIPMLQVSKCILAGDHKQLPPTIISEQAAKKGLNKTLHERVADGIGEKVICMLTTQYRMHKKIMEWPSKMLYNSKLVAASSVAQHLLCDIPYVEKTSCTSTPLVFVDTSGCHMYELVAEDEQSKGNEWEVEIISKHVKELTNVGLKMKDIGIITPYNMQVDMLRKSIHSHLPDIEINSVDGFQGREKEAILISMVRSNDKGEVGFLAEDRRTNVAITRARRYLFIVADSHTLSCHPFLKSFCSYLHENADVYSAKTFIEVPVATVEQSVTSEFELPDSMLNANKRLEDSHLTLHSSVGSTSNYDKSTKKKPHSEKVNCKLDEIKVDNQAIIDDIAVTDVKKKSFDIDNVLKEFMMSSEKELALPCTLSAKDRALCHERAEEQGLNHTSIGSGKSRQIIVSIPSIQDESKNSSTNQKNAPSDTCKSCNICKRFVPAKNYNLHIVRCERNELDKNNISTTKQKDFSIKKKKEAKVENYEKIEQGIDTMLDTFTALNSNCSFQKCSKSVKTLGQKCTFCSQMFCLTHHMPEIHGCGEAAKIKARQDIAKYKGSLPKKMNDIKKGQVQKKLNNTLKKMESERKKKTGNR